MNTRNTASGVRLPASGARLAACGFTPARGVRLQPDVRLGLRRAARDFRLPAFGSRLAAAAYIALTLTLTGCRQDMHDQPKYKAQAKSDFFADSRAGRPLVAGTVARGFLRDDTAAFTGREAGKLVETFPFPVTAAVMARGRERYDIFCAPCHGRTGWGDGLVVRRGYRRPPAFHDDRLREMAVGHFFSVITNGFGAMPDYAQQIPPEDRWAIVAYLRALQRSHQGTLADVPAAERARLDAEPQR